MRLTKSFTSFAVAFEAANCPALTSAMPPCAAFVMKSLSALLSDAAEVPVVDVVADVSVADVLVVLAEVSDVAVSFFLHPNAIKETIAKRKSKLRLISSTPPSAALQCTKSSKAGFTTGGKEHQRASRTHRWSCKAERIFEADVSADSATA